jgi:hypothetical protein
METNLNEAEEFALLMISYADNEGIEVAMNDVKITPNNLFLLSSMIEHKSDWNVVSRYFYDIDMIPDSLLESWIGMSVKNGYPHVLNWIISHHEKLGAFKYDHLLYTIKNGNESIANILMDECTFSFDDCNNAALNWATMLGMSSVVSKLYCHSAVTHTEKLISTELQP